MAATKYAPADWHVSNSVIQSTAERQRNTAHDFRQQSNTERNETDLTTRWTQYKTDCNLTSRISNLFDLKDSLTKTLNDTEEEINTLTASKRTAEYALEAKVMPLEIALKCLDAREQRIAIDYVRDTVESELHKEVEVISGIRGFLQQRIGESYNQLCVLHMCHQRLSADVSDKHMALSIDSDCAALTNKSDNVSMQPDPTRIQKGIVTPDQWEVYSIQNIRQTEGEIALSARLREAINQTIRQTSNDLDSQWIATDTALRGRIHEMSQTKKELEWQKKNTEEEIDQVNEEIKSLEEALRNKHPPMMVAHTRLENRTYRPNVELCRDNPQHQLVDEVDEIKTSQKSLYNKLQVALLANGTLNRTLDRINNDIYTKTNSLNLDQQCLDIREKLSEHPKIQQILQIVDEKMKKQ